MFSPFETKPDAASSAPSRTHLRRALLFGVGLLLLWGILQFTPSSKAASESPSPQAAPPSSSTLKTANSPSLFTWGNMTVFALLAAGGAFAYYLHRRKSSGPGGASALRSLESLPLSQDQQLRLISCADEVLLVGVTGGEITLLKTYPRAAFEEHPAFLTEATSAADAVPAGDASPFADILKRTLSGSQAHA